MCGIRAKCFFARRGVSSVWYLAAYICTQKNNVFFMFQRNELWVGLVLGLLLPLTVFAILYAMFGLLEGRGAVSGAGLSADFRERTLALVALAVNLLPLRVYRQRRWEAAMRGIVVATGLLALVWLFRFGPNLF
jgi:hypothetical protein